jgi:uncharacterized membrane protein
MKKIGMFQTWNKEAGNVEVSSTRIYSGLILLYLFYFDWYFMSLLEKPEITLNFIMLNVVFLVAAFYPKYLKELIDLKNKIK